MTTMARSYIPLIVAIDEAQFPCKALTWDGQLDRWNGWVGTPYFDRATAEKVVAWSNALEEGDRFRWEGDVLVGSNPSQYPDEPDWHIEPEMIEGEQRWCIGGWSWTWWDVTRPADLLPEGQVDDIVHVNGWLYVISADGSLEALDSRDPRYIPLTGEVV